MEAFGKYYGKRMIKNIDLELLEVAKLRARFERVDFGEWVNGALLIRLSSSESELEILREDLQRLLQTAPSRSRGRY